MSFTAVSLKSGKGLAAVYLHGPGELGKMISTGQVIRLHIETYKHWFEALSSEFREKVIEQWGVPEQSGIMTEQSDFIIPAVQANKI